MKKGPYKMKYTNGKKADVSAFPFKDSPVKFTPELEDTWAANRLEKGEVKVDKGHTHTEEYIISEGGQTSSSSLDTV